jgi:N-acetylmuramoyl-L-alanine amidase
MKLAISSGHGKYVRGASGVLDEVDEARRVVWALCDKLIQMGHEITEIHDDTSTSQNQNLDWLVTAHNKADRQLDISVHFNAYEQTSSPMGVEVLYVTQQELADEVSAAIAKAGGLIDRGPKFRDNLAFLNGTDEPAILLEVCFCDSSADASLYEASFGAIVDAIASSVTGTEDLPALPARPEVQKVYFEGETSWFGGPSDDGVSPSEGLAFLYEYDEDLMAPGADGDVPLFLEDQPSGTSGLARRLNSDEAFYLAARWDYDVTSKEMLARQDLRAAVRANGRIFLAQPADWGPHADTGRASDLSPALLSALGITTDDYCEVIYPVTRLPGRPERPKPPEYEHRVDITAKGRVEVDITGDVYVTLNGKPVVK